MIATIEGMEISGSPKEMAELMDYMFPPRHVFSAGAIEEVEQPLSFIKHTDTRPDFMDVTLDKDGTCINPYTGKKEHFEKGMAFIRFAKPL